LCSRRSFSGNFFLLLRDGRLEFGDCALLFCDLAVFF
jgi:hypothetical protein